jgi:hypothetical protein
MSSALVIANLKAASVHGNNLNVRQLLNPIFYSSDVIYGDSKRSLSRRVRARERRAERNLKRETVGVWY